MHHPIIKHILLIIITLTITQSDAPAQWPTTRNENLVIREDPLIESNAHEKAIPLNNQKTLFVWNETSGIDNSETMYQIVDCYGEFLSPEPILLIENPTELYSTQDAISDGEGGAIVLLNNDPADSGAYIWMQRIDEYGNKLWGDTGRVVVYYPDLTYDKMPRDLQRDPVTGDYFVYWWHAVTHIQPFIQKLDANGYTQWGEFGVAAADSGDNNWVRYNDYLAPDSQGGVYFVHEVDVPYQGESHFLEHLDSEGNRLLGGTYGQEIYHVNGPGYPVEIEADGHGGAYISTFDGGNSMLLRVDGMGNVLWEVDIDSYTQFNYLRQGGHDDVYLVWSYHSISVPDYVLAQRVSIDGEVLWGFPSPVLSNIEAHDFYDTFYKDNYLYVCYNSLPRDCLICQKVNLRGELMWGDDGVVAATTYSHPESCCSDGEDGMITIFMSEWDLYAKRVLSDGSFGGNPPPVDYLEIEAVEDDILLRWTSVSEAEGYRVYRKASLQSQFEFYTAVSDTFYTDIGAGGEVEYFYQVKWVR